MIKENFFYTFFEGGKKTCTFYICCGLNLSLVEYFSSQLDFYSKLVEKGKKFPITRYMVCIMHLIFSGLLVT